MVSVMVVFGKIQSQLVYLLGLKETYKTHEAARNEAEGSYYLEMNTSWPSQVQTVFEHIRNGDGSLLICNDGFDVGAVYALHDLRPPIGDKLFLRRERVLNKKQLVALKKRKPIKRAEKNIVHEPLLAEFYVKSH